MKITNTFTLIFISIILLFACSDNDDPNPVQLLDNPSVEDGSQSPFNWFKNEGSYQTNWTDEHAFEGNRSLKISSDNDIGDFGYWGQTIVEDIPYGKKLRFSCQIKLEGVAGEGVSIALRGDSDTDGVFFYTTQGDDYIAGTEDWQKYSIEMPWDPVSDEVTKLLVFVILLDDTEGTVYFDDFELIEI